VTEIVIDAAAEIARLEAANAKLRDRNAYLESRVGSLMVDGDRRERAALDRAEACAEHGRMLTHWQRLAEWHWAAAGQQEAARQSVVTELILIERDELAHRSGPVPVGLLSAWLRKAIDAQKRVKRRPDGWWPLQKHLHLGCSCSTVPTDGTACQAAQAGHGVMAADTLEAPRG
jgi:hypothetical protein